MATEAPPAPATAPQSVRIVESGPPKPPPAPTREINARDIASIPDPTRPGATATPPKSSRQSLRDNLTSKAKPTGQEVVPTPVKEPPKDPETPPEETPPATTEKPDAAAASPKTTTEEIDPKTGKPKKANPWKLYDEEKKLRAAAEQEVQRLRTSIVPEQERTTLMDRVTKAEKRNTELENEIRFVAYEKSKEFVDTYQAPYEAAWKRATTELSEITLTDPNTQQQRPVTSQDLLELVNLPLGRAREIADELFGRFADDVMAHRKEIRGLFEKQQNALDDARKNGGTREQQRREDFQKRNQEIQTFVQTAWKEADDSFKSRETNGQFFKPKTVEAGKQLTEEEKEWNDALERGYKLVDEAWGKNALAPGLKPEERKEIIKKNVAVKNRAAAFGPLKRQNKRLLARIEQLESDLKEYTASEPGAGGRTPATTATQGERGMEGFKNKLRKIAH